MAPDSASTREPGHERLAARAQAGQPALDRAERTGPRGVRRAGGARAGGTGRAGRSLAGAAPPAPSRLRPARPRSGWPRCATPRRSPSPPSGPSWPPSPTGPGCRSTTWRCSTSAATWAWSTAVSGCSDLGWRRERSVSRAQRGRRTPRRRARCGAAHHDRNRYALVTAFWYPGFVPANAFALTGDGLIPGRSITSRLPRPARGPGATSSAAGYSGRRGRSTTPLATCGRGHPRAAFPTRSATGRAGWSASRPRPAVTRSPKPGPGPGPLLWHTNHGRYLSGAEPEADGTSAARGETLDTLGFRRKIPARHGSWTSSSALRRAASAPTPGRTAAG